MRLDAHSLGRRLKRAVAEANPGIHRQDFYRSIDNLAVCRMVAISLSDGRLGKNITHLKNLIDRSSSASDFIRICAFGGYDLPDAETFLKLIEKDRQEYAAKVDGTNDIVCEDEKGL